MQEHSKNCFQECSCKEGQEKIQEQNKKFLKVHSEFHCMRRFLFTTFMFLFVLFSLQSVSAQEVVNKGSVDLLALFDNGTSQVGSIAKLELELRPGRERVYLQAFPMTKITTQASLRFAQQVACRGLSVDCSKYDFLFTIHALPGIVGGPSAGSAAAFLTSALLLNKSLPEDVALTGTINSGGIIGPVGGVRKKVEAAANNHLRTVYVPPGAKAVEFANASISMEEFGKSLNLTVVEAPTIWEVVERELGVSFHNLSSEELMIDSEYSSKMREVSSDLCARTEGLRLGINDSRLVNFTVRAKDAFERGEYYAAASYCFRANVEYRQKSYLEKNLSLDEVESRLSRLLVDLRSLERNVKTKNLSTLTDLQTFMAVMERINEARELAGSVSDALKKNKTDAVDLAFAEERAFSAKTWARFFDGTGGNFEVNVNSLKRGCAAKISEAEERYNYVRSVIPNALENTREDIDKAYSLLRDGNFALCLYTASKAKSQADVLLGLMGVEESRFDDVIDLKLQVARNALMRAQENGVFPIIAYSYYEYARSLRDFDKVSSLLFAEYALELANLDLYFKSAQKVVTAPVESYTLFDLAILSAFVFALVVCYLQSFKTLQAPPKRRLRGKKR
ncbi:hypothetical protein D6825_03330 [Candidatus Woesearchaeota archaeon]|nr:MAG: hypothetical protein D6825_03330 [Candidatus Woesearchaeota archaeon]